MCIPPPRCFALVENTGLEQATALDRIVSVASMDNHESIMGLGVAGSVHSVLVQCSPKLFEVCVCGWVGGGGVHSVAYLDHILCLKQSCIIY